MITFSINRMLYALSKALDMVEQELVGATSCHSKRVSYLCIQMGKAAGLSPEERMILADCAVMHDSALTEYIHDELADLPLDEVAEKIRMAPHCTAGEENVRMLPLGELAKNAVLYHHENADGSGAFGKVVEETPLLAQLIHFADQLDVTFGLGKMSEEKLQKIRDYLSSSEGVLFSPQMVQLYRQSVPEEELFTMTNDRIDRMLSEILPPQNCSYSPTEFERLGGVFAKIIDYKSPFTNRHSLGIAEKAKEMGIYYGYDEDTVAKLYFAGAVHDIGKLIISNDILDKPDHLSGAEYATIQNHAYASYDLLHGIDGLEDVTAWAYLHHEKLDGSGYPFRKTGKELNHNDRLMGCLDIYQALVEARPYREGMPHQKAIAILSSMAQGGKLDRTIVADIDHCFQ